MLLNLFVLLFSSFDFLLFLQNRPFTSNNANQSGSTQLKPSNHSSQSWSNQKKLDEQNQEVRYEVLTSDGLPNELLQLEIIVCN